MLRLGAGHLVVAFANVAFKVSTEGDYQLLCYKHLTDMITRKRAHAEE